DFDVCPQQTQDHAVAALFPPASAMITNGGCRTSGGPDVARDQGHGTAAMTADDGLRRGVSASPDHAWITHSSTRDRKMALTERKMPGQGHDHLCAA
ncbi:hypothetical protein, partial [Actinoplanes subtropicus]|uniref:hypothetical protein n=1 Tax=Actinoplanes subtropicus TaxID=543632 RepID=UPI001B80CF82